MNPALRIARVQHRQRSAGNAPIVKPPAAVEVAARPGAVGWYDVISDGRPVNDKALRKAAADALARKVKRGKA